MSIELTTTAYAVVTIEVPMSNYGPDWKMGDMMEQVRREAPGKIRNLIEKAGGRVVGEVKIKTITGVEKSP